MEKTLQDKIRVVKDLMQVKFPNCRHTIRILLWDDGTDLIECRHSEDNKLHISTHYKDKLTFETFDMKRVGDSMLIDESGTEYIKWNREFNNVKE